MHKFIQTICLFVLLTFALNTQAQIINIPDSNFKAKLLAASSTSYIAKDSLGNDIKIDVNDNGEIEINEAIKVYHLDVQVSNISSLNGINSFTNLIELNCQDNLLSTLNINNLSKLKWLYCYRNQIISLNVNGLSNLETLHCSTNMLITLNLSGLGKLKNLYCNSNQLTSLDVSGLDSLQEFGCGSNQLTRLDVSGLSKLQELYCSINQLTSLNVIGLNNLQYLSCGSNKLTTLNLSGLPILRELHCGFNNQLQTIYMKNNLYTDFSQYTFNDNSNLRYICADDSDIIELKQNILNNYVYMDVTINSFCSTTLNGSHYNLIGTAKYDANNNGCTIADSVFPFFKIKIKNAIDSGTAIANAHGDFAMVLDGGSYTITPHFINNYFISTPTSTTVTFPEDTIPQQFCITPNGSHHDISVTIIPLRAARPGFSDAAYKIVLKNKGTQIENGTIIFNYDESRQDYISSTNTPSNIQSGQLTYTFSNLQLFETREIIVTMRTNAPTDNPAVNAGDVLILSVSANINADENLSDNSQTLNQTVIGSFDPNDKTCLEGDIITPALVGDFVHYLIRFENTGTANAENVVVTDFIDLNTFDISTLEITSTSHNCKTLISNGNKVQFVFDNINLPFTEPLKHGYVAFKIKLKNNLGIGDSLKNKADIYFDYNLPITTNTAASRIDNVTVIKTNANKDGSLSVYPNPSNGYFTVNFESPVRQTIIVKIVAINGNVVYEQNLYHNYQSQLQLNQNLPAGVYLITVNSEKEQYTQKLIITK